MKRYATGDIHGAHKALLQVIDRSGIDKDKDLLICLGDVADGWPEVIESFEELLTFKNLVYVYGNHDNWLYEYLKFGLTPSIWLTQGGRVSFEQYRAADKDIIERHLKLLTDAEAYHVTDDNKVFVHGGLIVDMDVREQLPRNLTWNRDMYIKSLDGVMIGTPIYDEIFIGHTTTSRNDPTLKPVNNLNIWNLDQGCGYEGKLTLMDIDTKEYWQSDIVKTLYPDVKGR